MHICLPDTIELKPAHGSAYLLYNVHINGLYHCSLRYKQLLHLHQTLSKRFSNTYHQLPPFPPKRLLPLSSAQVEERRSQLEKYLQNISRDKAICNSSIFNLFLLEAQRESTRIRENQVHLDVELVNGQKIRLQIVTHDSADAVLTAICRALGLDDRYHAYFCLCLCGYDVIRDKLIIKRRLSFFESPYVTLQMAIQQQEQLQNVLSNSYQQQQQHYHPSSSSSSSSLSSSMSTATTNTSSSVSLLDDAVNCCRCQSCSTSQQQQQYQSTTTTSVPLVGSSSVSSSYVNQYTKNHFNNNNGNSNNNNYQHQGNQATGCCYNHHHLGNSSSNGNRQHLSTSSSSTSFVTHRILLRKSYWDPLYDSYLLNDQQALNLLFIQTVYDIKHSLMFVDRETYHQLESLLASDSKMDYILLARTLKYYNYVHFEPCLSDYPRPRTKVMISIGSKELNMRVLKSPRALTSCSSSPSAPSGSTGVVSTNSTGGAAVVASSSTVLPNNNNTNSLTTSAVNNQHQQHRQQQQHQLPSDQVLYCTSSLVPSGYRHLITKDDLVEEEYNFKVPLIRCWRLTSLETLNGNNTLSNSTSTPATKNVKRTSTLSLFNSVVGNNNSPPPTCENGRQQTTEPVRGNLISSGTGGASLMSALTGGCGSTNENAFCRQQQCSNGNHYYRSHNNINNQQQHYAQHQSLDNTQFSQYELSFEYLVSKDTLRWITISSDQAIFISISLQGVVDELVSKRDERSSLYKTTDPAATSPAHIIPAASVAASRRNSTNSNGIHNQNQSFTYMYRDGSQKMLNTSNQQLIDKFGTTLGYSPMNPYALALARQRQQVRASSTTLFSSPRFSSASAASALMPKPSNGQQTALEISSFKKAPSPIINDAFEGVANDDDL